MAGDVCIGGAESLRVRAAALTVFRIIVLSLRDSSSGGSRKESERIRRFFDKEHEFLVDPQRLDFKVRILDGLVIRNDPKYPIVYVSGRLR